MTKSRGQGQGDKRLRTPSATKRQPTPKPEVSNRTGTSPSGKEWRPLSFSYKKGSCVKDEACDHWHLPFFVFSHTTTQIKYESSLRSRGLRRPSIEPHVSKHQTGFEHDREQESRRKLSACFQHGKSMLRGTLKRQKAIVPNKPVEWSACDVTVICCPEVHPQSKRHTTTTMARQHPNSPIF